MTQTAKSALLLPPSMLISFLCPIHPADIIKWLALVSLEITTIYSAHFFVFFFGAMRVMRAQTTTAFLPDNFSSGAMSQTIGFVL